MYRIGVDVGGSTLKIGLVAQQRQILQRTTVPFPHTCPENAASQLAQAIRMLLQEQAVPEDEIAGIGVVVPGSIDPTGELVLDAHNLDFHHVPFRVLLQAHFPRLPVHLANDADGAALAELGRGAFLGCRTAVLLTLGTGVGGGVILDGKLFPGGCRRGVELGHMPLVSGGEPCTCGNRGCVEAYCSATALIRDAVRAGLAHPDSLLAARTGQMDAKYVFDCARQQDAAAQQLVAQYISYLGSAVISVIHLLDPEVIAIGGGVCNAGDILFTPLRADVDRKCFFESHGRIVRAVMGNEAGMVGAAMLINS